ncbi:MAG: V-type ATP synthase subunit D [Clostridiales bacterium]|jgi:V/A-type H+-transporting ATPase subunit D|nr:V-type ATP synthase subunit D [Clostridiales bacterium]
MDPNTFPTKGNLIKAKATLAMSRMGYDLIDRKRNVLIKEILELNDKAERIQRRIFATFREAYLALQDANIVMGLNSVRAICYGMPVEDSVTVRARSIMGVEIPTLRYESAPLTPSYGLANTTASFDVAVEKFRKVKELTFELAMAETAAYRLAMSIKKTQRRANALKNITIPRCEALTREINLTLEERERDEFTRLKVIKKRGRT